MSADMSAADISDDDISDDDNALPAPSERVPRLAVDGRLQDELIEALGVQIDYLSEVIREASNRRQELINWHSKIQKSG